MKAMIYSSGRELKQTAQLSGEVSFTADDVENDAVSLYPDAQRQQIIGFGGALTESAAYNYALLDAQAKRDFISAYFDPQRGLGYNFCRLPIHSCDFSLAPYTYTEGCDPSLATFSVEHDKRYLFPLIEAAQSAAGKDRLEFFSSPWSPPAWMKDSGSLLRGGRLLAEYASCWAEYIVRYLLEYRKQGVEISAVTIQNEPHAVQTWESCQYTAEEEAEFAVRHLRPTLDRNGLSDVGIILWDHNKERLYQRACDSLSVPGAAQAVWGIGFHWYSGSHFDGIALTAAAFPEKKLIATEFCLGGREGLEVTVDDALRYARELAGDLKSGACACVDWNVLLDEKGGPYHDRGFGCKAPVIYDKIRKALHYTPIFNAIGHFSRFIERGAVSIGASVFREDLLQAAVRNPDGKVVLVLANTAAEDYAVNIRLPEETAEISICGKSMLTVVME